MNSLTMDLKMKELLSSTERKITFVQDIKFSLLAQFHPNE